MYIFMYRVGKHVISYNNAKSYYKELEETYG